MKDDELLRAFRKYAEDRSLVPHPIMRLLDWAGACVEVALQELDGLV
jgi:hypothetical protein